MKKKICVSLLLFILIICFSINISNGHKVLNVGKQIGPSIERTEFGGGQGNTKEEAEMLEQLKIYGYDGEIKDEIRWETTVTVCINRLSYFDQLKKVNGNYWYVKFNDGVVETDQKYDNIRITYACTHHKPTDKEVQDKVDKTIGTDNNSIEVYSYKAVIIAKKDLSNLPTKTTATGDPIPGLRYFIDSIYTDNDMEEGNRIQLNEENTEIAAITGVAEAKLPNPKDALAELFGKLMLAFCDLVRVIPDGLQIGINTVSKIDTIEAQTANAEPEELTASYETIQADSKKNERAQVTTGDQNKGDPNKQTIVNVDAKDVKFSEETEIPIIPLDMYNIIYGKIDFLDVNFFNVDKTKHQEGSKWMYIRKIFAGALHIMLYLCSGFLIAVLIIHGIAIVKGTMIPEKKKEHIDGLRHFVLALIMLVCSVLIMNLCIYGINFFTSYFGNETGGDAFIRVNIAGDTNYSFSANLTEFARFMTQINTVKKIGEKLMYIFIYGLLVFSNIATLLTMLIRSAMIVILSIQGPIVATAYSLDKNVFNMSYSEWVKKYLKWTSVQFILMILYRIIITLGKM